MVGMRSRHSDSSGLWGTLSAFLLCAAWFGTLTYYFVGALTDVISTVDMRSDGVHTTGHAVSTRLEKQTTDDGTFTVYYTRVEFTAGAAHHTEEVTGKYSAGEDVSLVYDRDDPGTVNRAADVGLVRLVLELAEVLLLSAFILLGIYVVTVALSSP